MAWFTSPLSGAAAFAAVLAVSAPTASIAFPERPLSIVVPASTGGSNDLHARTMARFLSEELGQPVSVVNRPGGGNLLGHTYFLAQPDDGYTILRTTVAPYITFNQLLQGADFTVDDFEPLNLPEVGTSMIATANDSDFKTIDDVIARIRDEPGTLTVGIQPTATDAVNMRIFLEALGATPDDVRFVTYDSGGPLRNAIMSGQFNIGVVGDQSMGRLRGEFRPLMLFSEEPPEAWDAPSVVEVAERHDLGAYDLILSGSMQGYLVHASLGEKHPERRDRIVAALQAVSENPEAREAFAAQTQSIDWIGPEASLTRMKRQHELLSQPDILSILSAE